MGFFKNLRGNRPETTGGNSSMGNEAHASFSGNSVQGSLNRPQNNLLSGPRTARNEYAGSSLREDQYELPTDSSAAQTQPHDAPPPYHDWTVVPDTALLPPPPSLGHDISPTNNASRVDADRAHEWCDRHSLVRPHQPTSAQHDSVMHGEVGLLRPREFRGQLSMLSTGTWRGTTSAASGDSCIITSSPLYFACADSPWQTEVTKTIYFEVKLRSLGHGANAAESSVALGFCAMPYPTWRLPGWERGSLAVHGDDGRRYVNDTWGGKDFTSAFNPGDTVGLGMSISVPITPPEYETLLQRSTPLKVDVFFTRNGRVQGMWDLHEELDASRDLGVEGLDGQFDLYGAVGCFGGVEFDCLFNRRDWLWLPK